MEPIILVSSSPRRQEILKMLRIPFQVTMPHINEDAFSSKTPQELPEILAKAKVESVVSSIPEKQVVPWILGADTVVIMNQKIYGKPTDQTEAFNFIKAFQGHTHTVVTGLALYNGRKRITISRSVSTRVTFIDMTDEEIEWYVETGDWHGAAGGYRIQGQASCFISKIEGTSSCVVGLPIFEFYDMLKSQGYSLLE